MPGPPTSTSTSTRTATGGPGGPPAPRRPGAHRASRTLCVDRPSKPRHIYADLLGNHLTHPSEQKLANPVNAFQGSSVFVIITKMIITENQEQRYCPEMEMKYACTSDAKCKNFSSGTTGNGYLTGRCVKFSSGFRTCEIQGWCPTEMDGIGAPIMMEAENFTIFIKNSIRFPLFDFEKGNLADNLTADRIKRCRFNPDTQPDCPIFRLGDVVKLAGQNFSKLADKGGVLGIKIGWVCDLDRSWDDCTPKYTFTRLDSISEKNNVSPGYNFRYAKHYKRENGSEYRTLLKAFGIRIDVLVYGNAGKFNIIPTLINTVAAFTSVGVGTVLCDIILLNFLKGADQYKAKKFEEVTEVSVRSITSNSTEMYKSNQTLTCRIDEKRSTDSGAFSIGH